MAKAFMPIIYGKRMTLQEKRVTPTREEQTVYADEGYDALSSVTVEGMPPSADEVILQEKTVTPSAADQRVLPDEGYSALSAVNVKGDSALISSNIKKNVTLFGVLGAYEGEVTTYAEGVSF